MGCHRATPSSTPQISRDNPYLDLQPGWRLRVVAPVLESGGYKVKTEELQSANGSVDMRVEKAFLGYQADYYTVNSPAEGKPIVAFQRAEFTSVDQIRTTKKRPGVPLFVLPDNTRYVRLLFFTRVSETDHDEAVLSASTRMELDALTAEVEANPAGNCILQPATHCTWVPEGVAVQVERRAGTNSKACMPVL